MKLSLAAGLSNPLGAGNARRQGAICLAGRALFYDRMAVALGLLSKTRFLPLFATQFLGAVNDNLFKNALVGFALMRPGDAGPVIAALAGGIFILPYGLFSALAGEIADRHEKARLIRLMKRWELLVMLLGACGFLLGDIPLLGLALFGLGVQAAFFSPLKYGILPDHLSEQELLAGNGLIETGTFLGILLGTIAGGILMNLRSGPRIVSAAGLLIALGGITAAAWVPAAPPRAPAGGIAWNPFKEVRRLMREARANRPVWLCLLALSWFWAMGALLLSTFPIIARATSGAEGPVVTLMLTVFSLGVGLGSMGSARLLRGEISARLLPWAALGIAVFMADFAEAARAASHWHGVADVLGSARGVRMLADLLMLSACGGGYSVPLYAICQACSEAAYRSRMIAANNILNAGGMVLAAACTAGFYARWQASTGLLLGASAATLGVTLWLVRVLPEFHRALPENAVG
jgi:MFS family permease